MNKVISIAAARAERLKQTLAIHARNGEAVLVEIRGKQVTAEKIVCRDRFAEIIAMNGDYLVIDYNDIRALHTVAVAQTSVVNARGEFPPAFSLSSASRPAAILPFAPRHRRR